ncbi:hypothetical protein TraAM80_07837 [Trypanosoma rangeli]|uniref:Uncharacterized protein n=1 Tax=Trypanosoma rangeli TaxID=5698 RepID=A0A422N3K3_TRYRA|nr:uncharacterized protein TraAM80_07837 [Trypanosoma rangeli]RNF00063.1 hypothetical protein TraAM80_07837 [Trypanosoma rangeli]|eukprot:RNF00063.1 hypothetical protein TraAM80_07837 [Trypanosoma rangeli]
MRARRVVVALPPHVQRSSRLQQRFYTPIWQPDPAVNHVAPLRESDETRTLWSSSVPIANVGDAVSAWIRFGNDPVLHTALPVIHAGRHVRTMATNISSSSLSLPRSTSPFAYVEDYMGTNMVFGSPEHVKDSAAVWASYFERRYLGQLRQSRRTAANHMGLVNVPEVFTDEADRPDTKWSQDTVFREYAYMAERFLKEKVSNLEQFEQALKQAQPAEYLAFHDALQQQAPSLIPLPSPSVWHYEGPRRTQWAERFVLLSHAAQQFFLDLLAPDVKKMGNAPEKVLQRVAAVFAEVAKILLQRYRRCLNGREWSALSPDEKDNFCMREVARWAQQVEAGEFDPPLEGDGDIPSAEWEIEHDAIMQLMTTTIEGLSFSALDFWTHTIRCEEVETEHIHTERRVRAISAAARKAMYDATPYEAVLQGFVDAVARGQLDMAAAGFKPRINDIWCQLHYAKFGAPTMTQHTTTASRQLHFFHAGSLKEVAATATLYYATKPLSSSLDYASPYKFRRSLVGLFSTYGVEMAYAIQRPLLLSAANLAKAEDLIRSVVKNAARPFGERRRAKIEQLRADHQRLATPVQGVMVSAVVSELLEGGADVSGAAEAKEPQEAVTIWPLGARRAVLYDWPTPHLEALKKKVAAAGSAMTAQCVKEIQEIKRHAFVEVSLWRRVTTQEAERQRGLVEEETFQVAEAVRSIPSLAQVQKYATSLYHRIEDAVPASAAINTQVEKERAEMDSSWEFVVMLDDRAVLNVNQRAELYLPYTDAKGVPFPQGEYRVRVRGFDMDMNPTLNPALCSEAFSKSFHVFDAVPQLVQQFFGTVKPSTSEVSHISSSQFVSFCAFLREAGLDVPVRCEFEVGQVLNTEGNVFMEYFLDLLRGDRFHQSCAQAGLTEMQRAIEPSCRAHWEVHHPGANEAEWAEARRCVLDRAMEKEREWWFPNEMLDVTSMSAGSTNSLTPQMYPAAVRYGRELCTVLPAEGQFDNHHGLTATCVVDGTGAGESIIFSANHSSDTISIDEALSVAKGALRNAHDRHNTLSAFRLGPLLKQAQVLLFCGVNGMEFGGKYARTYAYAFEKAKKELAATFVSGREVPGVDEDGVERVSDKEGVDRFASSTHPEQRKTQFVPRRGPGGAPIDDPTADQKSEWGR